MFTIQSLQPFAEILLMIFATILVVFIAYFVFRKNRANGFRIMVLLSLLLLYFLYCNKLDKIYQVPPYVTTFKQLAAESNWPLRMTMIQTEGQQFVEAVIFPGKLPALIRLTSFRSGMPAYVFDLKGKLIDSTIDHHDDHRYQTKWEDHKQKTEMNEAEFTKIIENKQ